MVVCCCNATTARAAAVHAQKVRGSAYHLEHNNDVPAMNCALKHEHYACAGYLLDALSATEVVEWCRTYLSHYPAIPPKEQSIQWLVDYLLARGVHVNTLFTTQALRWKKTEYIHWFMKYASDHIDVNYVNPDSGRTVLFLKHCQHDKTFWGQCQCRDYISSTRIQANFLALVEYGADANYTVLGVSALENCLQSASIDFIQSVFAAGYDIERFGVSLFVKSIEKCGFKSVRFIMDHVAHLLNVPGLMHSIAANQIKRLSLNGTRSVIRKLRKLKIDFNERDADGNTPLHIAVPQHYELVLALIFYGGADISAVNNAGLRPIDLVRPERDNAAELRYFLRQQY